MSPVEAASRAETQLQVAEANLEMITALLNAKGEQAEPFTMGDLIANAEARTRLGWAWMDLASLRALIP